MAEANTKKRKREADPCRITYHAPEGRIFERLFKEESLEETKGTVRGKLGLPEHTPIHLTQLREGKVIELEDDDDFESFQILAKCVPSVEVRVTVGDRPRQFSLQNNHTKALLSPDKPEGELSSPGIPRKKRKKKRKDTLRSVLQLPTPSIASEQGQENPFVASPVISHPPVSGAVPSSAQNHADESLDDQPKKKKRKLDPKPTVDEQPTAGPSTPTPATAPEDKAKRKKRSTSKAEKASESVVTTPVPVIPSVKPKSTVVAPGAADEEASRPHKRKRKEKASEEPAPPAVSGVVTPQPADSPSVSKSKKKTKSKRVEENALAVERGVGSAPVPDPSPEESVPATSEDKKKRKRKKQVEEDASQTHVEPIPVFAPTSETLVQTSLTLEETKTKKKSSKKGQEPKSSQISADTFADVTKRIALEVCKDYASRNDSSAPAVDDGVDVDEGTPAEIKEKKKKNKTSKKSEITEPPPMHEEQGVDSELKKKRRKSDKKHTSDDPSSKCNPKEKNREVEVLPDGQTSAVHDVEASKSVADNATSKRLKRRKSELQTAEHLVAEDEDSGPPANLGSAVEDSVTLPSTRNSIAKRRKSKLADGPPCPICLGPWHLRFRCPTIMSGPDVIEQRLKEFKEQSRDTALIKELETFLEKSRSKARADKHSEATAPKSLSVGDGPHSGKPNAFDLSARLPGSAILPSASSPSTRIIPAESVISEVPVEGQGEGSSDESSDDEHESDDRPMTSAQAAPTGLEALIRGPAFASQRVADMILSSSSDSEEDEDQEREEVVLEEEEEQQHGRNHVSRRNYRSDSSDEAPGEEDSDEENIVAPTYMDESHIVERDNEIFTSHKPVVDTSVREASPMIAEPGVTPQADEEGDAEEPSQPDVGGSRADSTNAEDVQFADLDVVESPQLSYPVDLPQEPAPGASPDPQAVAAGEQDAAEALEPSDAPQVDTPSEEDDVMAVDPTLEVDKSVLVDPGSQQQQEPVDTVMESPEVTAASLPQTPKPLKPVTQHVTPRLPPPYLSVRPNDSVSVQESIEVAEDMPESALRTPMKIQDPIEVEDDEEAEKERSPSPVYSTPKAGVAKRMRNRFGQVPFPVPEDVEEQLLSSRAIPDVSIVPVLQVPVVEISVTRSLRRKTAAAAVSVASNQAEKPPAIQPKRRGRQPLSEEEKARRAAAKQAEKEEKARLKKEKQEQAQAAKEAQKAQKAAERKAKRATSKRVTKITVVPAQEHEEEPEPDVATAPEKDETIVPETPQPDNEQSLAQWATLEPLQSQPTFAPSEASIDQLYPSTPQPEPSSGGDIDGVEELVLDTTGESHDHRAVTESPPREVPDDAVRKEPLFLPSESQSQALLGHTQQDHAEVIPSSPPVVFGTEEEDQELALPVPVKKALPASQPAPQPSVAPYRRLTDIASSQGSLFSRPSGSLPPAIARKPHAQEDLSQLYPDDDDEDSDDDDDDSDEDGKEEKSHIPKNRRAGSGVGVSMRRTAGLLKFI